MAELYQGKRKLSKGGLTPFQFAQKYGFEGTEQEYFSAQREAAEHLTDESNPHNVTAEQVGAAPAYTYGTEDLTAGSSALETGKLYFVYE